MTAAAQRLEGASGRIGDIRSHAVAHLATIGRWTDRSHAASLLLSATETIDAVVRDHLARAQIAADLDAMAWADIGSLGASGVVGGTVGSVGAVGIVGSQDERIAQIEAEIAAILDGPASAAEAMAVVALREKLAEAREMVTLEERISGLFDVPASAATGAALQQLRAQLAAARRVSDLEDRIAKLEKQPPSAGVAMALANLRALLAEARGDRNGADDGPAGFRGAPGGESGDRPVPHIATEYDDTIADLEARLANLEGRPASAATAMALRHLRDRLDTARRNRLASLQDPTRFQTTGPAEDYFDLIRSEIAREIELLGYDHDDFQRAALAMMEGQTPSEAGLDEVLFPTWYLDNVAVMEGYRARLDEFDVALGQASDAVAFAVYTEKSEALEHQAQLMEDRTQLADAMNAEFPDGLVVDLSAAAAFLAETHLMDRETSDQAVGEFVAHIMVEPNTYPTAVLTDLAEMLTTEDRAVAFFNSWDSDVIQVLPHITGGEFRDDVAFMEPISEALAMASHSADLQLDPADLVGEAMVSNDALWFLADGFNPDFLIAVAQEQAVAYENLRYASPTYGQLNGEWMYVDPRAIVADRIADAGPEPSADLVTWLAENDLLESFLDPDIPHTDDGAGAGRVIGMVGANLDPASSQLIVTIMDEVAEGGMPSGIIEGAAIMITPHLPSLVSAEQAEDLDRTPLADLVSSDDEMVQAFLAEVMGNQEAAEIVFAGATWHLMINLDQHMDPNDPTSISPTVLGFGTVMDLVLHVYMDEGLADAERQDRINGIISGIVGTAIDLLVGAGIAYVGAITAPAWVAIAIGAVANDVTGAALTNIGIPSITDWGLSTDNVTGILEQGYTIENTYVHLTRLAVFGRLAEEGVVSLPAEWYDGDGALGTVTPEQWAEFEPQLQVQLDGVELGETWLTNANSVGGSLDWSP